SPVLGAQSIDRIQIALLQEFPVARAALVEQPQFMISEQRFRPGLARQAEPLGAVGAAVSLVPQQNQAIARQSREACKQFRELEMTTVNVANGDESPVHAAGKC